MLFIGDDWAEDHHDVEVQDDDGQVLARRRVSEGVAGIVALHALIADHLRRDDPPDQVLVGIETDRGPWVQALIAAGYQVFCINPAMSAKYRGRHSTSGAKSDPGDAHVLAEIVRLDRDHHRPIAGDSALGQSVRMLARAHQSMIWSRQHETNRLRSLLREYYPAALLMAADELAGRDAIAVLAIAPTPTQGRSLSVKRIEQVLRKAGRQRNLTATAQRIHDALQSEQLPPREGLEHAYGTSALAIVQVIATMNTQITQLQGEVEVVFRCHPDAEILTSLPGMGTILGARVLGEFGDDPLRYPDARSRRNYSGMSPITRTSGTKRVVLARYARNKRLADALMQHALSALNNSPGARGYYDQLRAKGNTHNQALRSVSRRMVGLLHACLRDRVPYDEAIAWPAHHIPATAVA